MDILTLDKNQAISSLTIGELEVLLNQMINKIIFNNQASNQEALITDEYKRDIPYNSEVNSIREIADSAAVPEDLWECVPSDASQNLDSYLYPKSL